MRRVAGFICGLLCAAGTTPAAVAGQPHATTGAATGNITYLGPSAVTIQTGGRQLGVINALTSTANALASHVYPYVYGGGHAEAGVASVGLKGPGYNGRRVGFDCSGSVAAVLAGAGVWSAGSGVPNDAGVIKQLLSEKLIAPGAGSAPDEVTLYDHPGFHIFMNINGRFFGTSDGGGGNPKGGPGWLDDGAPNASNRAYKRYHLLPSVLRTRTTYGQSLTFQTGPDGGLLEGAEAGDQVTVSYGSTPNGTMTATAIQYLGAVTTGGAVTAIDPGGATIAITTTAGQPLTLSTSGVPDLLDGLQVGDGVEVTYSSDAAGLLLPHALQIVSQPSTTDG
jgi:hypothetical protein